MSDEAKVPPEAEAKPEAPRPTLARWHPGDPDPAAQIARILRVDHAGEYGARRIYEGQLAVLGRGPQAGTLRQMHRQEEKHLRHFERLIQRLPASALKDLNPRILVAAGVVGGQEDAVGLVVVDLAHEVCVDW